MFAQNSGEARLDQNRNSPDRENKMSYPWLSFGRNREKGIITRGLSDIKEKRKTKNLGWKFVSCGKNYRDGVHQLILDSGSYRLSNELQRTHSCLKEQTSKRCICRPTKRGL